MAALKLFCKALMDIKKYSAENSISENVGEFLKTWR
jgi:hypothetical protein